MNGISSKPVKEFKVGAVRVAVWSNPRHDSNGKMFNSHKIMLERIYRDRQGNFHSADSLDINDIPKAILALKKAYEYLVTGGQKNENVDVMEGTPIKPKAQIP